MRRLVHFTVIFAAFGSTGNAPAFGQDTAWQPSLRVIDIAAHVAEAAQRFGLPEQWIYAVMRAESAGRIGAVSSSGAMGLMQLMPGTWARQRARFGLGSDPFDPRDNIMAGTSYLREMYDSYGAPGFLAAYNAGPGRYRDWRDRGRPLPTETRAYVARIAPLLQTGSKPTVTADTLFAQAGRKSWTQGSLFAVRATSQTDAWDNNPVPASLGPPPARSGPRNGLFVPVSMSRPQ